jgi:hypothetical protein
MTLGLSWFRPGLYVQQWCARGTVLLRTVVLVEGGYKRGGRGGLASKPQRYWLRQVPISWRRRRACGWLLSVVPCPRAAPPFIGQGGNSLHACRTISLRVEAWRAVPRSWRPSWRILLRLRRRGASCARTGAASRASSADDLSDRRGCMMRLKPSQWPPAATMHAATVPSPSSSLTFFPTN